MKKLLFVLLIAFSLQVGAQNQNNWITDYKIALEQSEIQNKPILAYVTDNQKSEASENLKNRLFNSNAFNRLASKSILLKLDVSDQNSKNARLGIHYTKQNGAPGVALVDENGKTLFDPLVDFSAESVLAFMTLWNDKLN